MNKIVLFASALIGVGTMATAQQAISFEISEGYTTDALNGQNNWLVVGEEGSETSSVLVSAEQHSQGANSLKFMGSGSDEGVYPEAVKSFTQAGSTFTITQDIYTTDIDEEGGSDLNILTGNMQENEYTMASGLIFSYTGKLEVIYGYNWEEDVLETEEVGAFHANTWYKLQSAFDTDAGTVAYYLNGELLYTAPLLTSSAINILDYSFLGYSTSFYVDDINISTGTAAVVQTPALAFSVYPNPANGNISISNTFGALVNNININDINGRIVKTYALQGVTAAQVDLLGLASGVYVLNIASDKGTVVKKIVVN